MKNKTDYKAFLQGYFYHGYSFEWLQGYINCLYVNKLINTNELYLLNEFILNLFKTVDK